MSCAVELNPIFLDDISFLIDFTQSRNQFFKSVSYTFGSIIMNVVWFWVLDDSKMERFLFLLDYSKVCFVFDDYSRWLCLELVIDRLLSLGALIAGM